MDDQFSTRDVSTFIRPKPDVHRMSGAVLYIYLDLPKRLCLETLLSTLCTLSVLVLCEAVVGAHCTGEVMFKREPLLLNRSPTIHPPDVMIPVTRKVVKLTFTFYYLI